MEKLGRYRLVSLLATGGMGEVFIARQEGPAGFSKTVVVKRILQHLARDPAFVDLFLNEARLAGSLSHPNVVQIFELGEQAGTWFIAMEHVDGPSLRALRNHAREVGVPFDPLAAMQICAQALHGLHYAHTATDASGAPGGLVHRDVSPDNVLVRRDGVVKVVDFGIAKAANLATTRSTTVKGKSGYLAPEQYQRGPIDARTDVFAVGVLLYELLTLARPFQGDSDAEMMHAVLTQNAAAPSERAAGIPEGLDDLVLRALSREPSRRYSTAEQMAFALEQLLVARREGIGAASLAKRLGPLLDQLIGGPTLALTGSLGTEVTQPHTDAERTVRARPARRRPWWPWLGLPVAAALALFGWWERTPTEVVPQPARERPRPDVSAEQQPGRAEAPKPVSPDPLAPRSRSPVVRKGRVQVLVTPWAEVFLGGMSLGITPLPPIELPAGNQLLTLRNPELGAERQVRVSIRAGETTTVRVTFAAADGKR